MPDLTFAPFPAGRDLIAALLNDAAPDEKLAAPWCRPGDRAYWFSRSAWSLAAIARWRQRVTGRTSITVWLPDFFCNESLTPLRNMGAQLRFYPLSEQMSPDSDAMRALAEDRLPDLVVLVHFFGQPALAAAAVVACRSTGAWLIEDAAHGLRPTPGIGEYGDFVLYSPHKYLPIPDGAVLVVRENGPARKADQVSVLPALQEVWRALVDAPGYSHRRASLWLIKRIFQRLGLRAWRRPPTPFLMDAVTTDPCLVHPKMSPLAKRLLSILQGELDTVAQSRRQHWALWKRTLTEANPAAFAFEPASVERTPYLVTIASQSVAEAEALYSKWYCAGLPVATWPDLPPEVSGEPVRHRRALQLRQTRVYLPLHQSLDPRQIVACGRRLTNQTMARLFQVDEVSLERWDRHWLQLRRANLLQCWQYGAAKEQAEGWRARRFLISDSDGHPIALAQLLTRTLPVLGGIARLNRGPLLLSELRDDQATELALGALRALLKEAGRRRWWLVQIAPELPATEAVRAGLERLGMRRRPGPAWASGRLALGGDEKALLMGLDGKWRNCLRKGERLGVTILRTTDGGPEAEHLISRYCAFQRSKGFEGISETLLHRLAEQRGATWNFDLFAARAAEAPVTDEPIGMLVSVRNGDTATYLIGSTNEEGRRMQANSVMLWHAILHAKRSGCTWFDVGGLSAETPKGIADFKKGLNATPYALAGEWRAYLFPWNSNELALQNRVFD